MRAASPTLGIFSPGIPLAVRDFPARGVGIAAALALHTAILSELLQPEALPAMAEPVTVPVTVEFLTPAQPQTATPSVPAEPARPKAKPPKPKAKPVRARPAPKHTPLLTRAAASPAPPQAPTVTEAAPVAQRAETAPVTPAAAPVSTAPAPISPPSFHADYLNNPAPAYPAQSREQSEQGRVLLRVLVNAEGGAERVEIRRSSGYHRLDEAARATVQRWRFVPAKQAGQALSAWVLVPISFSLEG